MRGFTRLQARDPCPKPMKQAMQSIHISPKYIKNYQHISKTIKIYLHISPIHVQCIRVVSRREPPAPRKYFRRGLTWRPTKSRLHMGSSLAVLGLKLGRTGGSCEGFAASKVRPKTGPMWATWRTPIKAKKRWKRKLSPRVALSPQNWPRLGVALSWTHLKPKLAPIGHVGLKLGPKRSRWTPN